MSFPLLKVKLPNMTDWHTSISRKFQEFRLEYVMKGLVTVTSVTMILLTF